MSDLPNPDTQSRRNSPIAPAEGAATDPTTPEQAVDEIRAQLEAQTRERDEAQNRAAQAERERDEARTRAATTETSAWASQEQAVDSELRALGTVVEQAKNAIETAQAAGDGRAVAEAFDKLADARAAMRDLGNRKNWLGEQKKRAETAPPPSRQTGHRVVTPGGAMENVTVDAKQWMDEHPRFYNDPAYYNHAVAAHSTAVAQGNAEGSPAYFRALSEAMQRFEQFEAYERGEPGNGNTQMNGRQPPANTQRRMSAAATGAPVSRATTPVSRDGTPDPLSIARSLGDGVTVSDLREFARINGYGKDEAGFQRYLKDQKEIADIARVGGDTGMRVDGVWR